MACKKKKLDKIGAMLVVANSRKNTQKNFKRKEKRYYWCVECQAHHTTSKKKNNNTKETPKMDSLSMVIRTKAQADLFMDQLRSLRKKP